MANDFAVEERVARLEGRLDEHGKIFDQINYKLSAIENRFNSIDNRFNAIDNRFNAIDIKFTAVDNRFAEISQKIDSNFRWTLGIIITTWITVVAAILLR